MTAGDRSSPSGWPLALLGDVCEVNIGRTPARERQEFWGSGSPWLSIADMTQGRYLNATAESITDVAVKGCNCRIVAAGTVLLSFKLSIGKVGITTRALYTNEAIAALPIKNSSKLLPEFLYWALRSADLTTGLDRAAKGKTLNKAKLLRIRVPIPPLTEQRRIADILQKADAVRSKRRAALADIDTLAHSIFVDMFGDGTQWAHLSVAKISSHRPFACVGGPFGSELTQADYTSFGVPVIRGQNLATVSPFLSEDGYVFVSERKALELERNTAERGDVVVSQRGARLAGQVALIPETSRYSKYVVSQSQMKITADPARIDPLYLVYFFRSPHAVRRMERRMTSTGVPHINLGILRDFLVAVPPLSLQRDFARRVEGVELLRRSHDRALMKLDTLFASLQHRAFSGEL